MTEAKNTKTTTAAKKAASPAKKGAMKLPDLSEFDQQPKAEDVGDAPLGRVAGLDYDKWAAAIIDLQQSENRIATQRSRLAKKGYKAIEGDPIVGGFENAEVWVIPRSKWIANKQKRGKRITKAVRDGLMMDSATKRGTTQKV